MKRVCAPLFRPNLDWEVMSVGCVSNGFADGIRTRYPKLFTVCVLPDELQQMRVSQTSLSPKFDPGNVGVLLALRPRLELNQHRLSYSQLLYQRASCK